MRLLSRRVLVSTAVCLAMVGLVAAAPGIARQRAAAGMATAAAKFLSTLTPEQRQKASYSLGSEEWTRWHFIPASMFARNGLPFKEMNQSQRAAVHDLMKASLSQSGYMTANSVIQLENVLREMEGPGRLAGAAPAAAAATAPAAAPAAAAPAAPPAAAAPAAPAGAPAAGQAAGGGQGGRGGGRRGGGGGGGAPIVRDPELYYVTVFGDPGVKGQWGWRIEGHHVSLRFAVDNGKMQVSSTPQFIGSNPAEVPYGYGPYTGLRVLAAQEDSARALVLALSQKSRAIAIIGDQPRGDVASSTTVKLEPLASAGLAASAMTSAERGMLMKVIETYANVMPPDVAADRMAKIKAAGLEKISFAWSGSTEKGQRHHYQIQGPTFLIEHNNTQNNGNHVHSVWRAFNGDFGRDILAEHMAMFQH
jgi:hypothetical protein